MPAADLTDGGTLTNGYSHQTINLSSTQANEENCHLPNNYTETSYAYPANSIAITYPSMAPIPISSENNCSTFTPYGSNHSLRIPFSPSCGQAFPSGNNFCDSNTNVSQRQFWSTCDLTNAQNRVVFPPSSDLVIGRNAPRASVMGLLGTLQIPNERNSVDGLNSRSNSPETTPYVTISRYIPPTLTPGRLCNLPQISSRESASPIQRVVRSASASTGLQPTPTLTRSPRPSPVLRISESYDSSGAGIQFSNNDINRNLNQYDTDASSNSLTPDFRSGERVPFIAELSPSYNSNRITPYAWIGDSSSGGSIRLQVGGGDTSRLTHLALNHLASAEPPSPYLHSPPPTYDQVKNLQIQLVVFLIQ